MSSTTSVLSTNKASSSGRADQKLRRFQLQKCIFFFNFYSFYGSRDSLLVRVPDSWSKKVASSNPGRSGGWIVFSRVNFVCWLLFDVRSTPVLPQWHVKDPGHSAGSAGGRLNLNMHTPLAQRSRSGWLNRCPGIVWEPIRKLLHTQLVRVHSVAVVSARWATVDWSWPKDWS